MADRAKMAGWYDPARLVPTAIRVAISTVFGEFADRRESMGAAREIDLERFDRAYDYSKGGAVDSAWFDFIADTGDGWNPTYAIARLVSDSRLVVPGLPEQQGVPRFLVLGGDQVYPTASREEYRRRLQAPFDEAARSWPRDAARPDLYAVPGNHDWYDGLSSFMGLFCSRRPTPGGPDEKPGRVICGRQTQQTRSYFALRLPQNWWLWGADVQLKGYIDQPQIDFFAHVARHWMDPGAQLILCTGCPEWAYVNAGVAQESFKNFAYLERLAEIARKDHRLRLVLTGDSHHYSRYEEDGRQYITAGGGGAFLHPTHQLSLERTTEVSYPPPGSGPAPAVPRTFTRRFRLGRNAETNQPSVFPSMTDSKRLSWRNLLFPLLNWQLAATLGVLNAIFTWLLDFTARAQESTLPKVLSGDFWSAACGYLKLVYTAPWPMLLMLAAVAAYRYLADFTGWRRWVAGLLHAAAQVGALVAVTLLARCLPGSGNSAVLILYAGVLSGLACTVLLGAYFLACLTLTGKHWNEAFSSLRIEDYKCFLRMHIDREGTLTVYPIGLAKVPRDDGERLENPPLKPELIEPPIKLAKPG